MYLPDDRYATLVAFIEGVSQGSGRGPMADFQYWLAGGERSPRHWSAHVIDRVAPGSTLTPLTLEQEEVAKQLLLSLLGEYMGLHEGSDS